MVNNIKEELSFEESLSKKIEFICDFTNNKPTIINGNIRKIDKTNLTYIKPHRIIINNNTFLAFKHSSEIIIEDLSNKIKLSELEDYLKYINKQITKLNKDKDDISDEINKNKKINNKIIIKSKNQLLDENKKLKEENEHLKSINYQTETIYNDLKEKTDYLTCHLNKIIKKLPECIQELIDRLFNYNNINLNFFNNNMIMKL